MREKCEYVQLAVDTTTVFECVHALQIALRILGFDPHKNLIQHLIDTYAEKPKKGGAKKFDLFPEPFIEIVKDLLDRESVTRVFTRAFRFMDRGHKGFICRADLRRIVEELGIDSTNRELDTMLEEAGANEEGKLTLRDFLAFSVEN